MTILTENCLIAINQPLWIDRAGLRGLDLNSILSWWSKSGSHWSGSTCSHRRSKWRWLNVLGLVRRILNSHWWSCKLLWLFHYWGSILWNFLAHRIMHWWRLNCLNWCWIHLLNCLRLRNWSRWSNYWLFHRRWSDYLMHWFLLYLILCLHLILILRNLSLILCFCRIKSR